MHDSPPPLKPYYFSAERFFAPLGSIIKFPPSPTKKDTAYKDLICTEQDRDIIYEIISTLGRSSKLSLLMKSSRLRALGEQIDHVHPLKFLAAIFIQPELKECMWNVFDDYFKRSGFMDGLAPSLTRKAEAGQLNQHLEPFSTELSHHPHNTPHIKSYFSSQDWEGLVQFLMQN